MPLEVFPLASPGTIQESVADPSPSAWSQAQDVVVYRGRMALRAPLEVAATLTGEDSILGIAQYTNKIMIASWDADGGTTTGEVRLWSMDFDGTNLTNEAQIWNNVTTEPTAIIMTPFTAGIGEGTERLYIADFDQNFESRFWNGTALTDLDEDLDNDSTAEATFFSFFIPYQFHLWAFSFLQEGVQRPELVRFSTPGLIPLTDFASGNDEEWHIHDHISFGRRGDQLMGGMVVNGKLIIFQQTATHTITGFSRETWTKETISSQVGAVGPLAFDQYSESIGFFWSPSGPMLTDGNSVQDIGEPIRQKVNNVDFDTNTVVRVDPVGMLVFFFVQLSGEPQTLVYSIQTGTWTQVKYKGSDLEFKAGARVLTLGSAQAPPPDPSGLTVLYQKNATDNGHFTLDWTNGTAAVGTQTEIYRSLTSPVTTSDTLVATLGAGVSTYQDDVDSSGLNETDEYFYAVRHTRGALVSSLSNEDSDLTAAKIATDGLVQTLLDGIRYKFTNNSLASPDIEIYRRQSEESVFTLLTTLTSQTQGQKTYDDEGQHEAITCGDQYRYRVIIKKAGFPDTLGTAQTPLIEACLPPPGITNIQINSIDAGGGKRQLQTTWDWVDQGDAIVEGTWDSDQGSSRDDSITTSGTSWTIDEIFVCPSPGGTGDLTLLVTLNGETIETYNFTNVNGCSGGGP